MGLEKVSLCQYVCGRGELRGKLTKCGRKPARESSGDWEPRCTGRGDLRARVRNRSRDSAEGPLDCGRCNDEERPSKNNDLPDNEQSENFKQTHGD